MSRRRTILAATALALLVALPAAAQNAAICIDAGHGGSDPGAVANGIEEKDVNLTAALAFRDWLQADSADGAGGGSWDVYMTRDSDEDVSLSARTDYANAVGVDYFMSIHANAGGGNGTETYAYASGTEADDLAHLVQEEVLDHLGTNDRGVKYADFYVLIHTTMPADLNEMAFLDTWAGNAELLLDEANLDQVGLAHLNAIQRHVGLAPYEPAIGDDDDDDDDDDHPTGSVTFADYPLALEPGEVFTVTVDYETDLHAAGQTGELVLAMQDLDGWDTLDQQMWDADGAGVQGPVGDHTFELKAPDDGTDAVFFVSWLTPAGAGWDGRLDDASTLGDPTSVGTGDYWVQIADYPTRIEPGEHFEVVLDYGWNADALRTPKLIGLELVEAGSGLVLETEAFDGFGALDNDARRTFQLMYDGEADRVWFHAFLAEELGSPQRLADDDTEGDPTRVDQPLGGHGCEPGCTAAPGRGAATAAMLLGLSGLALARRRGARR